MARSQALQKILADPAIIAEHLNSKLHSFIAEQLSAEWIDDALLHLPGRGELHLDCYVANLDGCVVVQLFDIESHPPGQGIGTDAFAAMKLFCEQHQIALIGVEAISGFWQRPEFDYLRFCAPEGAEDQWFYYSQGWKLPEWISAD